MNKTYVYELDIHDDTSGGFKMLVMRIFVTVYIKVTGI